LGVRIPRTAPPRSVRSGTRRVGIVSRVAGQTPRRKLSSTGTGKPKCSPAWSSLVNIESFPRAYSLLRVVPGVQIQSARSIGTANDIAREFFVPIDLIRELAVLTTRDGY